MVASELSLDVDGSQKNTSMPSAASMSAQRATPDDRYISAHDAAELVAGYVLTRAEITELAAESAEDPELVTS